MPFMRGTRYALAAASAAVVAPVEEQMMQAVEVVEVVAPVETDAEEQPVEGHDGGGNQQ